MSNPTKVISTTKKQKQQQQKQQQKEQQHSSSLNDATAVPRDFDMIGVSRRYWCLTVFGIHGL